MTEPEFEAYYLSHYRALLAYAVQLTPDFFLAEEAVNDSFVELWQRLATTPKVSYVVLKKKVRWRVADLHRTWKRVIGFVQVWLDERPLGDVTEEDARLPPTRALEDVVMDLITVRETLESDPQALGRMLAAESVHGKRSTYNAGCRCLRCKQGQRDYQRTRAAVRAGTQPLRPLAILTVGQPQAHH